MYIIFLNFGKKEKKEKREFPGSSMVRTLHFHSEGLGLIPDQGTKILHAKKKKKKKKEGKERVRKEEKEKRNGKEKRNLNQASVTK